MKHLSSSIDERRDSLSRRGYLERCRKFCPDPAVDDLKPYPAGIRAQAVARDGTLAHDFLFKKSDRMLQVLNAPSPAATSAIPTGGMSTDELLSNVARVA